MKIAATYSFEAAHWLPKVPDGHKCKRMHGHNYQLEVSVEGSVGDDGFIMDYGELDGIVGSLIHKLDHRCLNDISGLDNPTSEVLVMWLRERLDPLIPGRLGLRLYETPRYWVEG